MSVTQAALAVVGGIIGSSLLTIAIVVFVMRYRRKKQKKKRKIITHLRNGSRVSPTIGYPAFDGTSNTARVVSAYKPADYDNESDYGGDGGPPPSIRGSKGPMMTTNGYPADIKAPVPAAIGRSNTTISRKSVGAGNNNNTNNNKGNNTTDAPHNKPKTTTGGIGMAVGFATSYYGPNATDTTNPIPTGIRKASVSSTAAATASQNSDSSTNTTETVLNKKVVGLQSRFKLGDPPKRGEKFTLFPKETTTTTTMTSPGGTSISTTITPTSAGSSGRRSQDGKGGGGGGPSPFPTLDTWLHRQTDVSPFSTLRKDDAAGQGSSNNNITAEKAAGGGGGIGGLNWPIRR